jgi:hypothetical protein
MNICVICLDPIEVFGEVELECKHFYHKECLKDWCKYSCMSPCCRKKINIDFHESDSCSEDDASVSSEDNEYNVCM